MTRDCGVGSSADMPRDVWVVMRETLANPFYKVPVGVFCNARFAQFWIKNQPEDQKRNYNYFVYHALGNPEAFERTEEQRLPAVQDSKRPSQ